MCEGQRVASERGSEVGKGSKPLFRAGTRRCLTCVPCYPSSHCSAQALKSADCSWRQQLELTAGSGWYRALPVMMFRNPEYQITLSSSSISWEGRKNQDEEKICSLLTILFNKTLGYWASEMVISENSSSLFTYGYLMIVVLRSCLSGWQCLQFKFSVQLQNVSLRFSSTQFRSGVMKKKKQELILIELNQCILAGIKM